MALVDGGDLVVRAIKQEGVDTIFTLCGGHVQAIYDSCLDEDVKVIDVRHEQVAGHAAEGWSRATRRCGVGVVTAGPGVTDCMTGIANAWHNKSPMLIIGGRSPLSRFEMGVAPGHGPHENPRAHHEARQVHPRDQAHPGVHLDGLPRGDDGPAGPGVPRDPNGRALHEGRGERGQFPAEHTGPRGASIPTRRSCGRRRRSSATPSGR